MGRQAAGCEPGGGGRDNGFPGKARRKIALAAAEAYRTAMRDFAKQSFLDVWYAHMDIEEAVGEFKSQIKAKKLKAFEKLMAKAHTRDSTQVLGKLTSPELQCPAHLHHRLHLA